MKSKDPRPRGQRLLRAALWHARQGVAVFPVLPGRKAPAVDDWPNVATTDAAQIRQWWEASAYNIGVATGPSELLVIDLDQPKTDDERPPSPWLDRGARTGSDVLDLLTTEAGERLPRTWTTETPSGGRHLYFRQPADGPLGNTAGRLGWRIDTRGHGGYVLGAGSAIGHSRYQAKLIRKPAPLPDWIAQRLAPPAVVPMATDQPADLTKYGQAALRGEVDQLLAAAEGQRNDALNRAAFLLGQLIPAGALHEEAVRRDLLAAAERIGLGRREADRTIHSGLTAGISQPRHIAST